MHEAPSVHADRIAGTDGSQRVGPDLAHPVEGQTNVVAPQRVTAGNDHVDPQRCVGIDEDEPTTTVSLADLDAGLGGTTLIDEWTSLSRSEDQRGTIDPVDPRGGAEWGGRWPFVERPGATARAFD
jgi:hypothetical protein